MVNLSGVFAILTFSSRPWPQRQNPFANTTDAKDLSPLVGFSRPAKPDCNKNLPPVLSAVSNGVGGALKSCEPNDRLSNKTTFYRGAGNLKVTKAGARGAVTSGLPFNFTGPNGLGYPAKICPSPAPCPVARIPHKNGRAIRTRSEIATHPVALPTFPNEEPSASTFTLGDKWSGRTEGTGRTPFL